jgi:hypothetical protein
MGLLDAIRDAFNPSGRSVQGFLGNVLSNAGEVGSGLLEMGGQVGQDILSLAPGGDPASFSDTAAMAQQLPPALLEHLRQNYIEPIASLAPGGMPAGEGLAQFGEFAYERPTELGLDVLGATQLARPNSLTRQLERGIRGRLDPASPYAGAETAIGRSPLLMRRPSGPSAASVGAPPEVAAKLDYVPPNWGQIAGAYMGGNTPNVGAIDPATATLGGVGAAAAGPAAGVGVAPVIPLFKGGKAVGSGYLPDFSWTPETAAQVVAQAPSPAAGAFIQQLIEADFPPEAMEAVLNRLRQMPEQHHAYLAQPGPLQKEVITAAYQDIGGGMPKAGPNVQAFQPNRAGVELGDQVPMPEISSTVPHGPSRPNSPSFVDKTGRTFYGETAVRARTLAEAKAQPGAFWQEQVPVMQEEFDAFLAENGPGSPTIGPSWPADTPEYPSPALGAPESRPMYGPTARDAQPYEAAPYGATGVLPNWRGRYPEGHPSAGQKKPLTETVATGETRPISVTDSGRPAELGAQVPLDPDTAYLADLVARAQGGMGGRAETFTPSGTVDPTLLETDFWNTESANARRRMSDSGEDPGLQNIVEQEQSALDPSVAGPEVERSPYPGTTASMVAQARAYIAAKTARGQQVSEQQLINYLLRAENAPDRTKPVPVEDLAEDPSWGLERSKGLRERGVDISATPEGQSILTAELRRRAGADPVRFTKDVREVPEGILESEGGPGVRAMPTNARLSRELTPQQRAKLEAELPGGAKLFDELYKAVQDPKEGTTGLVRTDIDPNTAITLTEAELRNNPLSRSKYRSDKKLARLERDKALMVTDWEHTFKPHEIVRLAAEHGMPQAQGWVRISKGDITPSQQLGVDPHSVGGFAEGLAHQDELESVVRGQRQARSEMRKELERAGGKGAEAPKPPRGLVESSARFLRGKRRQTMANLRAQIGEYRAIVESGQRVSSQKLREFAADPELQNLTPDEKLDAIRRVLEQRGEDYLEPVPDAGIRAAEAALYDAEDAWRQLGGTIDETTGALDSSNAAKTAQSNVFPKDDIRAVSTIAREGRSLDKFVNEGHRQKVQKAFREEATILQRAQAGEDIGKIAADYEVPRSTIYNMVKTTTRSEGPVTVKKDSDLMPPDDVRGESGRSLMRRSQRDPGTYRDRGESALRSKRKPPKKVPNPKTGEM